jgi:hypothetical protein
MQAGNTDFRAVTSALINGLPDLREYSGTAGVFPRQLCVDSVTFPQPQAARLEVHSSRPLLDVFSQETNLAPRKRGLFLV